MKKCINLVVILVLVCSPLAVAGKKRCKSLLQKFENIQAIQRNGYSAKQGIRLQQRADKARDKWWQCENSVLSKPKKKKAKDKKTAKKYQKVTSKISTPKNLITRNTKPLVNKRAVVVKSRFKGKQQQAWLNYYRKPNQCKQIKSLKMFAYCTENKNQQQQAFVRQYKK